MGLLKILILTPFPGTTNPYLSLFTQSLREAGGNVSLACKRGLLPLWSAIRESGRADLIHLQWHDVYFGKGSTPVVVVRTVMFFFQAFVLRLLGTRFVWTVHNVLSHERQHPRWELMACRAYGRFVDRIIVHCEVAARLVGDAYRVPRHRISVVPHGHYAGWYPPPENKAKARKRLQLPHDTRVFLFFGLVREYKGLENLLDAFQRIDAKGCQLLIIGKPHSPSLARSLLERAAQDSRVLTRFEYVPDDVLVTYLGAADLVVLPYRDALTSGAAILAASYGRPVLVPRHGCMQEFPPDAAILYDPERPQGLAEAITRALSAPLESMGHAAKRHVAQHPWSDVASQTLAVYQEVARSANAA